jgi:hypothetical protein
VFLALVFFLFFSFFTSRQIYLLTYFCFLLYFSCCASLPRTHNACTLFLYTGTLAFLFRTSVVAHSSFSIYYFSSFFFKFNLKKFLGISQNFGKTCQVSCCSRIFFSPFFLLLFLFPKEIFFSFLLPREMTHMLFCIPL